MNNLQPLPPKAAEPKADVAKPEGEKPVTE
jgi:hypothetical protein